jgi:circadian clock protein KaiC
VTLSEIDPSDRQPTGVEGLDAVLRGGFPTDRIMLIEGAPGTGKTTLALQFLLEGQRHGKKTLFISVAQSRPELAMIAASHGMDLSGLDIMTPELGSNARDRVYSVASEEADLHELIGSVTQQVEEKEPDLLVFDSLLELRLLASNSAAYRRELLSLRSMLQKAGTTAILIDHVGDDGEDRHAEGIVHGVIKLEFHTALIGPARRRLKVLKLRGADFSEGWHDFRIRQGGIDVFPRVVPREVTPVALEDRLVPPHAPLADMLGGGVEFGSSLLIAGQAGTGKSTLAGLFAIASADRGVPAAVFVLEERIEVLRTRSAGVGLDTRPHEDAGTLHLRQMDPVEVTPGEFSAAVLRAVDDGARVIVIDSLSGYLEALPEHYSEIMPHIHSLLQALVRREVLVIVTMSQHGLLGEPPVSRVDTSFLADSVILLRQYEAGADIRRSIAVLKKRHGEHERRFEELVIRPGAVEVRPLSEEAVERTKGASQLGSE